MSLYSQVLRRSSSFLKNTFRDRFKKYLIISLVIMGVLLMIRSQRSIEPGDVDFFYLPGCSHCDEQRPFNARLADKYPDIEVVEHNAATPQGSALLSSRLKQLGVKDEFVSPVTVITVISNGVLQGWISHGWEAEETTGAAIEDALRLCLEGRCPPSPGKEPSEGIRVPWLGRIVFAEHSLAALAVILGLVDGFNPCALWVLIYLISLVATLRDKRKIWLIVGSFVLASGVLYFLMMALWLNAFLLIGLVRPVEIIIGLVALGGGIWQVREHIKAKGDIVCEVTSEESRQKTMSRMQRIVASPVNIATIVGVIGLAFLVNSVEFVCSIGVPMVFTQVLALSNLSTFHYYAYILLYVFFFMLDNLVIFGSAALALTSNLGVRYARYARPVGAAVMIILGLLILFAPGSWRP